MRKFYDFNDEICKYQSDLTFKVNGANSAKFLKRVLLLSTSILIYLTENIVNYMMYYNCGV